MPNVAPRGLFARDGSAWKPPANLWARYTAPGPPITPILNDSFSLNTANWVLSGGGSTIPVLTTSGHTGKGLLVKNDLSGNTGIAAYTIPVASQSADLVVGFWWKVDAIANFPHILELFSDNNTTNHTQLQAFADGSIAYYLGGTNLGSSAPGVLTTATWYAIELKVHLADAPNGSWAIRVNGVTVASQSGVDTKNSGTKTVFDTIRLTIHIASVVNAVYDDVVVRVGPGAGFAGDPGPAVTTWKQANYVWAYHNGAWQLIWGLLPSSPSVAPVITYVAGGSVTVTWVAPFPLAVDGYEIRRSDGSLVGTASKSATTFTDVSPLPLNGAYTVAGLLGGLVGPVARSNSLDLSVGPATISAVRAGSNVSVTWTAPAYGQPTNYQLLRDGAALATIPGNGTLQFIDGATPGTAPVYSVVAILAGVNGGSKAAPALVILPLDPINVAISTPSANILRLNWNYPGGTVTGYDIEVYRNSTSGPWTSYDSGNYSGQSDWQVDGNGGYMRVRSTAPSGASNWVQVGPIYPMPDDPIVDYFGIRPGNAYHTQLTLGSNRTGETYYVEQYFNAFPGWNRYPGEILSANPQNGDNGVTTRIWYTDKLQLSPTYNRVRTLRNGVYSNWVQVGPA